MNSSFIQEKKTKMGSIYLFAYLYKWCVLPQVWMKWGMSRSRKGKYSTILETMMPSPNVLVKETSSHEAFNLISRSFVFVQVQYCTSTVPVQVRITSLSHSLSLYLCLFRAERSKSWRAEAYCTILWSIHRYIVSNVVSHMHAIRNHLSSGSEPSRSLWDARCQPL